MSKPHSTCDGSDHQANQVEVIPCRLTELYEEMDTPELCIHDEQDATILSGESPRDDSRITLPHWLTFLGPGWQYMNFMRN